MRRIFRNILLLLVASASLPAAAQSARELVLDDPNKAGGVYYAYPGASDNQAEAPDGYEPFYISHYGRHGSRYLISDDDYLDIIKDFELADSVRMLTETGKDVLRRLRNVWKEAEGRGGELTPLGARQHKEIARRMYGKYPQVFVDSALITARSTRVMRCAHSMFAFCEGLKELNPALEIPKESSSRFMHYLCWWTPRAARWNSDRGPWKPIYDSFENGNINPQRFTDALFTNTVLLSLTPREIMWGLYWIAVDMQNMECDETFFDLFTPEELYALWRVNNLSFYMHNADYPLAEGLIVANARNLLDNIITTADRYVGEMRPGATLRFGHDGNITPLAALMQFEGFDGRESDPEKVEDAWTNFKVTPMASNMQAIFFRLAGSEITPGNTGAASQNSEAPVLVKFMMNEQDVLLPIPSEIAPFYSWEDAREFLQGRVDEASRIIAATPSDDE